MTIEELIVRAKEIQIQDKVASEQLHTNEYTNGYIDGHLHAFNSIVKLLESLDK